MSHPDEIRELQQRDPEYDYELQLWYDRRTGEIYRCSHPETMRGPGRPCCPANRFKGQPLNAARAALAGGAA